MKEKPQSCSSAVIFDMDGLMIDTERPSIPLWARAGRSMGYDIGPEIVISNLGIDEVGSRANFLRQFGPDFPYDRIRKEFISLINAEFEKGIAHRPGLVFLLDRLASLGIPAAIATSAYRERMLWKLRLAGILERFTVIVCGDEIRSGKPAPDIFLLAAEKLGKAPAECVGFEDSPAGLRALHAAGIRSIFIKDLVEPPEDILATVWRRCNDLAEAAELFG